MIRPAQPSSPEARLRRIQELLDGPTGPREEREIVEILEASDSASLDHVMARVDLDQLFGDVDDHAWAGKYKTRLLGHLSGPRLEELSVENRRRMVDALQRGITTPLEESAAAAVLLGTRGTDLTALKNGIDGGGDQRDLQQLVYHDMDDPANRASLLAHFREEARLHPSGELKVLSDIDDTFYVNWKDRRYPEGTVYPGVRQYYRELDRANWQGTEPREGDMAFLTARPGDFLGLVKKRALRDLHERGLEEVTVLTGDFWSLVGPERMARKKVQNFQEYRALFPEYGFCFTGDSGQADPRVGELMLEAAPEAVRGVFIHDVVATPEARRQGFRSRGIHFFDTYVGAALEARDRGMLTLEAVRRVAEAALRELPEIPFASPALRSEREAEFRRDVERLNLLLPPGERLGLPGAA